MRHYFHRAIEVKALVYKCIARRKILKTQDYTQKKLKSEMTMGVNLTPLLIPDVIGFPNLAGKKVVIDGCNLLFKYITKIRKDNQILTNRVGDPVSHLIGVFYFIINLMERHIRPIFVFDGYPPREKRPKSPVKIAKLVKMWHIYHKNQKNREQLFSDPLFLYDKIITDLQEFIRWMGCPVIQGISEGEAQGARLVQEGEAFAMFSMDQDSLLFGCPRTIKRFLFKQEQAIILNLEAQLKRHKLTRRQLIDIALLVGTDYNKGIKGIGPKKAVHLIREYGALEDLPKKLLMNQTDLDHLRALFLKPATIKTDILFRAPNTKQLMYYLKNKGWSQQRINRGIRRLRLAFKYLPLKQTTLHTFTKSSTKAPT